MDDLIHSMFEQIFGGGVFDSVSGVLKLNPSTGAWAKAWTAVDSVYSNVMVPIALGLMIIWFLVAFMEKAASEQVTFEQLFILFAKLIAAKFLIDNGLQIFANLWSLGISLIDNVGGAFEDSSGSLGLDLKDLWYDFTKLEWTAKIGIIKGIGILCQLLIPWLVSLIMTAVVYFICYSRIIEMLLRMMAAPIALSDFMTEGLHGAGWRFLKNFLAICLQGMIMVAIAQIYPLVINTILNGGDGGFWVTLLKYVAFSFAAIALLFKSLSISKELVGTS